MFIPEEAKQFLRGIGEDEPVGIACIAVFFIFLVLVFVLIMWKGLYRTGKSFFVNRGLLN